jgi:EAL domain-containing protein (putative c-di-GMP-specific phosphodiesterase class I)/GGDEF domain-containing protein
MMMQLNMKQIKSEMERVDALYQFGILNTNTNEYFDMITRLVTELYTTSGAYISLIDSDRQWVKSTVGFCTQHSTYQREQTFCDHTIRMGELLVIEDTLLDPRFASLDLVLGPSSVRFYAGAPLVTSKGYAIGALCVIDKKPRTFSEADRFRLSHLAALLMEYIGLGYTIGLVDSISGMPNKYQMAADLEVLSERHSGQWRVLLVIDMPDFGHAFEIIRVLGIGVYDQLIRAVADKLKVLFKHRAQLYHLTDARFGILSNDEDTQGFINYLQEVEDALQTPLLNLNIPLNVSSFGGIAIFELSPSSIKDALRKAATAVNQALTKQQRWSLYEQAEDLRQQRAFHLLNDVLNSIATNQFQLLYQPKLDLINEASLSVEALLRWNHYELGMISPAEFIPLVEKTTLISALTQWVIRTAIKQVSEWHIAGYKVKVAVNFSAYNFAEPDIVKRLSDVCQEFNIEPKYVEIECTEGIWMEKSNILQTLHDIRNLGMSIALDDFGSGYSNFAYLQKVPANVVKLDQTLISNVHANSRDQSIVRSLITLAKELGYQVVAEGVETAGSLCLIREWGCHIAQGYYVAKPLTSADVLLHMIKYRGG